MPRPRDSKIDRDLLDAWRQLAAERDYGAITMEAVAARAGVGKAALYRRFKSKAHLAFGVLVADSAPETVRDRGDIRLELLECVSRLADSLDELPRQVYADQVAAMVLDRDFAARVAEFHAGPDAIVRGVLERAVERGEIRDDIDLPATVDYLGAALIFQVMVRHATPERRDLELLVDLFVCGLLPRPT